VKFNSLVTSAPSHGISLSRYQCGDDEDLGHWMNERNSEETDNDQDGLIDEGVSGDEPWYAHYDLSDHIIVTSIPLQMGRHNNMQHVINVDDDLHTICEVCSNIIMFGTRCSCRRFL
jgi:hypothetical protein